MKKAAIVFACLCCAECGPAQPCDSTPGSCLLLHLTGTGAFDKLTSIVQDTGNSALKTGDAATQITLPVSLRLAAPPGVSSSLISSVRINGLVAGAVASTGITDIPFSWPDGAHIESTVNLVPAPPGPFLTWREEKAPTGITDQLNGVWMNPTGEPAIAVGDNGRVLVRSLGQWKTESSTSTSILSSVIGLPGGTAWAAGRLSGGVWRRDISPIGWSADQPTMITGAGLRCITSGLSPGEVWVGSDDGKVYHRTGSVAGPATWTSEQAFPANVRIYGIAYAEGAVFAVGDQGTVAVRANSGATTPWTQSRITGNFSQTDWWNSVWAFDHDTAVAVGTAGSMIIYQGGQWGQTAQKIDSSNSEMSGVWGHDLSRLWVTSKNGFILRVDGGTTYYRLYSRPGAGLFGIYGTGDSNIFVVGGSTGKLTLMVHGAP